MGYDGVNANKTLTATPGQVYTFWIKLSGQPILNFFPDQRRYLVEEITVTLPCADDCSDNCSATVDCNIVADAIITAIQGKKLDGNTAVNGRKTIGGQPLSKYVKATKLLNCGTPSGYVTTGFTNYNLTILDDGSQAALASVQAQYPGVVVTQINRYDAYSTYQLDLPAASSAPAAYQNLANSIVSNCASCPSGYTYMFGL